VRAAAIDRRVVVQPQGGAVADNCPCADLLF
jgi:hypothetical protein